MTPILRITPGPGGTKGTPERGAGPEHAVPRPANQRTTGACLGHADDYPRAGQLIALFQVANPPAAFSIHAQACKS